MQLNPLRHCDANCMSHFEICWVLAEKNHRYLFQKVSYEEERERF